MDPLIEEEMEPRSWVNPFTIVLQFLASNGWYLVGAAAAGLYVVHWLRPRIKGWREAREEAAYHKNPDLTLARMEAIQRARERQQQLLEQASQRAIEEQKQREERKRAELVERLEKYGTAAGGRRLGSGADSDYLPLSGGGSTSTYRPPKRSKCGGGGCGR